MLGKAIISALVMSTLETKPLQLNVVNGASASLREATCHTVSWSHWLLLWKKAKLDPVTCSQLSAPHHALLSPASGSSWTGAYSARPNSGKLTLQAKWIGSDQPMESSPATNLTRARQSLWKERAGLHNKEEAWGGEGNFPFRQRQCSCDYNL